MAELPLPPAFASAGGGGENMLNLDDVFSDIFFSPDGELLELPSDDEGGVTLGDDMQHEGGAFAPNRGVHAGIGGGGGGSSAPLTEAQKAERREKNREHAKRSRVRKKFLLESLQRSVDTLQNENASLKASIREYMGETGDELIAKCVPEGEDDLVTSNPSRATRVLDDPDYSLVKALQLAQQNFVITDASLPDNPIVFASSGFLTLTGYAADQILGRNCRFLQGPETDPRAVAVIRSAIERGEDTSVCLLNYRADGTTFYNQFFVASLCNGEGKVVNYVGVQSKVSDEYARLVMAQQEAEWAQAAKGAARRK
ncbi:aureochrome1 [Tribonema minus]|uniref:Aureochrome1 n=1 Tax=Tribonema minus TaxID=303371 RepID=A0A836C8A6_9STRA|nr:aureochrome1 [Tribonema minus]